MDPCPSQKGGRLPHLADQIIPARPQGLEIREGGHNVHGRTDGHKIIGISIGTILAGNKKAIDYVNFIIRLCEF
jgi:hypothetical protein